MKKSIIIFLALALCHFSCGPKQEQIERVNEEGIEIVLNHIEPYSLPNETRSLRLERLFSIDAEDLEIFEAGLIDMETFDVDPDGNIYIIRWRTDENYIFKFDQNGNFLKSFCRRGQGPGEVEWGGAIYVSNENELLVKQPHLQKFATYNLEGDFLRETRLDKIYTLKQLKNGNYYIHWMDEDIIQRRYKFHYAICSSQFDNIRELDTFGFQRSQPSERKITVGNARMITGTSLKHVFLGNAEEGYEISAYDLDGNIQFKFRKEYEKAPISDNYKKAYLGRMREDIRNSFEINFHGYWPPFQYMFTDEGGRIFIMTYEQTENEKEYIFDIFNPEGIFIGRVGIPNLKDPNNPYPVRAKGGKLYYIWEKDSGYNELVVSEMNWE